LDRSARFEYAVCTYLIWGRVSSKVLIHETAAGDPVRWSPELAELYGCVFLASPGCTFQKPRTHFVHHPLELMAISERMIYAKTIFITPDLSSLER